jgi:hypothetical protein
VRVRRAHLLSHTFSFLRRFHEQVIHKTCTKVNHGRFICLSQLKAAAIDRSLNIVHDWLINCRVQMAVMRNTHSMQNTPATHRRSNARADVLQNEGTATTLTLGNIRLHFMCV